MVATNFSADIVAGFFGISDDNFVPVAFPPEGSGCNSSYSTVPTGNFSRWSRAATVFSCFYRNVWQKSPESFVDE
jgi:hypothetical protein